METGDGSGKLGFPGGELENHADKRSSSGSGIPF